MNSTILPLQCPQCGNTNNIIEKEYEFGAEFTCRQCGTTSVMVINQQLYAPRPGDLICVTCGRVSPAGTHFCQCGAGLLQKCVACLKPFPIYHRLCDHCGWPKEVSVDSPEGQALYISRAFRALADPDAAIRIPTQEEIENLYIPPSIVSPQLLEEIRRSKPNPFLQKMAVKLLTRIKPIPFFELGQALDEVKDAEALEQICHVLASDPEKANEYQERLLEMVKSSPARWAAYEVIEQTPISRFVLAESLIEILNHSSDKINRAKACEYLGRLGQEAAHATPLLLETLREDNPVRLATLRALLHIGAPTRQIVDALMTGYEQDANDQERRDIIQALAEMGASAVPVLIFLIERETSPAIEKEICHALAQIGEPAIPALMSVLKYKQDLPDVHVSACFALGLMKAKATPAVATLIELLNTAPPDRQLIYAYALGEIGNEAAVNHLIQILKQREKYAPHHLNVWEAAQQALIKIGEAAVPALRELSNSMFQSKQEREAARHALNLIERTAF